MVKKYSSPFLLSTSFVLLIISFFWATPVLAHRDPDTCSGSGLSINIFSSPNQAHIGDVISYSIDVFNGSMAGICNATGIQASVTTPDGIAHPISLTNTSLIGAQVDTYPNVVTYTARAQDVNPSDGTLRTTASTTGTIHQNDTDSVGGGDQGVNVEVLSTLRIIKVVSNANGGTAVASDFNLHVKNSGATDASGSPAVGTASPGTSYALLAGTYAVSEDSNALYTSAFSGDCDSSGVVTLLATDKTCTITNSDIAPPPPAPPAPVASRSGGSRREIPPPVTVFTTTPATTTIVTTATTTVVDVPVIVIVPTIIPTFPSAGLPPFDDSDVPEQMSYFDFIKNIWNQIFHYEGR